jgi:hypothetical protein
MTEHNILGVRDKMPSYNAIQIWKVDVRSGSAKLAYCLCHSFGNVFDMKWNSNISVADGQLGIVAVSFSDGSFRVACLPHPSQLSPDSHRILN